MVSHKFVLQLICLLIFFQSCRVLRSNKFYHNELEKIKACRKNWVYRIIRDTIEIELLEFISKSYGTTISHPNFFVGKDVLNDTIGIIDYSSDGNWSTGSRVKFSREEYDLSRSSMSKKPILYVSYKKRENDLQCAIKTVYYGKVIAD